MYNTYKDDTKHNNENRHVMRIGNFIKLNTFLNIQQKEKRIHGKKTESKQRKQLCRNFNSVQGCPEGKNCEQRHMTRSKFLTITNLPDVINSFSKLRTFVRSAFDRPPQFNIHSCGNFRKCYSLEFATEKHRAAVEKKLEPFVKNGIQVNYNSPKQTYSILNHEDNPETRPRKICNHFNTPKGCWKGNNCPFQHVNNNSSQIDNNPFQSGIANPFQQGITNPFQQNVINPFQQGVINPFQQNITNPFQYIDNQSSSKHSEYKPFPNGVCWYFNTPKGCSADKCEYSHVQISVEEKKMIKCPQKKCSGRCPFAHNNVNHDDAETNTFCTRFNSTQGCRGNYRCLKKHIKPPICLTVYHVPSFMNKHEYILSLLVTPLGKEFIFVHSHPDFPDCYTIEFSNSESRDKAKNYLQNKLENEDIKYSEHSPLEAEFECKKMRSSKSTKRETKEDEKTESLLPLKKLEAVWRNKKKKEWRDDDTILRPYPKDVSNQLEQAKLGEKVKHFWTGLKQNQIFSLQFMYVTHTTSGWTYEITKIASGKAIQRNVSSKREREVLRTVVEITYTISGSPDWWDVTRSSNETVEFMQISWKNQKTAVEKFAAQAVNEFYSTLDKKQYEIVAVYFVQNQGLWKLHKALESSFFIFFCPTDFICDLIKQYKDHWIQDQRLSDQTINKEFVFAYSFFFFLQKQPIIVWNDQKRAFYEITIKPMLMAKVFISQKMHNILLTVTQSSIIPTDMPNCYIVAPYVVKACAEQEVISGLLTKNT
ncbi:hypothetical protein RFI_14651 [Reticulomyxa filosa]|uniref:C3H1-type domain-containing protein n=1 Tax=Reticulomyxa filosa TaxID=46433 RepID=X6N9F0_RETFI|nr:hypothetical protein RFI_14651 [Reticulomyxa filosa]|eukprot:ETO22548.1 hypothetical protein RFI_14651 [Reticulomyxa filosa]